MQTVAILIACGKEEQITAGTDAAFLSLGNTPLLAHSLMTLQSTPVVDGVVVAVAKDRVDSTIKTIKRYGCTKVAGIVVGGANRLSTLRTVMSKLPVDPSLIIIQEATRPFLKQPVLEDAVKAAKRYGSAIAAHKIPDAVKITPKGFKVGKTLERNTGWIAQTPQVFKRDVLEKMLKTDAKTLKIIDDESEYVKKPAEVHLIEAGSRNLKIRSSEDLATATALLNAKLV
jgi:2-C-methyl-D-erythritol 4-phosphate cytidylyltransferase